MDKVDLLGIKAIINTDTVKPGYDLDSIEKELQGLKIGDAPAAVDIDAEMKKFSMFSESVTGGQQPFQQQQSFQQPPPRTSGVMYTDPAGTSFSRPEPAASVLSGGPMFSDNTPKQNPVLAAFEGNSMSKELEEEEKYMMLDEIDNYRSALDAMRIPHSFVPVVTKDSPMEDIKVVRRRLRIKTDQLTYQGLAREVFTIGAKFLEYVFDGTTKIGGIAPNLRGFTPATQVKLRNISYAAGAAMASLMNVSDSPWTRLLVELVPTAITCHISNSTKKSDDDVGDTDFIEGASSLKKK